MLDRRDVTPEPPAANKAVGAVAHGHRLPALYPVTRDVAGEDCPERTRWLAELTARYKARRNNQ